MAGFILDEMNLSTGEDKKNPLLGVKVKPAFKRTDVWEYGRIYYNETVELGYKDTKVHEDFSNAYNAAVSFDRRYLQIPTLVL